jgi:hypothetical protein
MKIARILVRFLCTICILIVGVHTVLAIAVAFFIVAGALTPGDIMFYDSHTPTLSQTLLFIAMSIVFVGGISLVRHKLSRSIPQ